MAENPIMGKPSPVNLDRDTHHVDKHNETAMLSVSSSTVGIVVLFAGSLSKFVDSEFLSSLDQTLLSVISAGLERLAARGYPDRLGNSVRVPVQ